MQPRFHGYALGFALSVFTVASAACGGHDPRVSRTIETISQVVITNSPTLNDYEVAHDPRVRGGRLTFDYALFAENNGELPARVALISARAALAPSPGAAESTPFRIACHEHERGRRTEFVSVLEPGQRTRIDCHVQLTPETTRAIEGADRELILALPVYTADSAALALFSYRLHAGDAR